MSTVNSLLIVLTDKHSSHNKTFVTIQLHAQKGFQSYCLTNSSFWCFTNSQTLHCAFIRLFCSFKVRKIFGPLSPGIFGESKAIPFQKL